MSHSILTIETSTARGAVALVRDGVVQYEKSFLSERSHNAQLFAPLKEALVMCGDSLQLIVVGTGPGSYTGARIGIAAAQGIALSRGVPVIGLPSVLAPDWPGLPDAFTVCGDARRGAFFVARVNHGALIEEISLHDAAQLAQLRDADAHGAWFTFDAKPLHGLSEVMVSAPSASRLAQLASRFSADETRKLAQQILEPVYLRAPFITTPK
jgi:tRNA threonylcarbamoyl adenosine modification protein YeaZ